MNEQEQYERMMAQQGLAGQISQGNTEGLRQQYMLEEKEKSMISEQLDLTDEISRIEHLLRGHTQKEQDGILVWVESTDPDMQIFTEYGIHLILNTISWYINKNTLLSNYDDKTILLKMKNFSHALNDTVFMQYEKVFKMPDMAECNTHLERKIQREVDNRALTLQVTGQHPDKPEIEKQLRIEIQTYLNVAEELKKIRENITKSRLARYMLLIREIQDAVHSTYNRAYQGQERKTLREHTMLSETRGLNIPQDKKGGLMKWFTGV